MDEVLSALKRAAGLSTPGLHVVPKINEDRFPLWLADQGIQESVLDV
jgi:hypothetical protein